MKCRGSFARRVVSIWGDYVEIACGACKAAFETEMPAPGMLATVPDHDPISVRTCDEEFGFDHDHDPVECARILSVMNGDDFDYTSYDYPTYDPDMDHYERFGRPMFPNEY